MDRGDVLVDWRLLARLAMLGVLGVYFVRTLIDSGKPEVLDFDARLARNLPSRVAPTPARGAAAAPQPARPQPRPTSLPSPRVIAPAISSATRATNETACTVCGVAANGDRSCCHPGGSWSGQCGSGLAHSWRDGYRACNNAGPADFNVTLSPVEDDRGNFSRWRWSGSFACSLPKASVVPSLVQSHEAAECATAQLQRANVSQTDLHCANIFVNAQGVLTFGDFDTAVVDGIPEANSYGLALEALEDLDPARERGDRRRC